jgi:hemerythrin
LPVSRRAVLSQHVAGQCVKQEVVMAQIEWKAEYQTGVPLVDEQHQHLVQIINKFDEFLAYWLITHILRDDKAFGPCLTQVKVPEEQA